MLHSSSFLPYLDLTIIYLFFIFQMAYNMLTLIKITQSKNKVSISKLKFAYFFWTYPIIYSIYPVILSFESSFDYGMLMIYLRIPTVILSALLIIVWSIYIPIHNKKVRTLDNISKSVFIYDESNFEAILKSKNFFKKNIIKTNTKFIIKANGIKKSEDAIKVIADVQGWFIGKDKFSWMWLNKKQTTQNFYKQIFENVCYVVKEKLKSIDE